MNASPVRFTGLTSGMDTQSMVQQLMRAESIRMDRLTRRRTLIQWRQEALRGSMTRMNDFRRDHTDANINTSAINSPAVWNTISATITNANNNGSTAGISVTTTGNATQGAFDIQVSQYARGDLFRSRYYFRGTPGLGTPEHSLTLPSSVGNVDLGNVRLDTFITHNNIVRYANNPGAPVHEVVGTYTYVEINGVNIRANFNDTIQDFMDRVNSNANVGANMRFDSMRGLFILEARGTGANAIVSTGSDNWGILATMGLDDIRPGAATGGMATGVGGTLIPSLSLTSQISDFMDNVPASVTIAGRIIEVMADESFGDFIARANLILSGEEGPVDTDSNVSLLFHNGRFILSASHPSAVVSVGVEGTDNELLNFMFGTSYISTSEYANAAYSTGVSFDFRESFDITTLSLDSPLHEVFPNFVGDATFVLTAGSDTFTISVNSNMTLGGFLAALNSHPNVATFAFDDENGFTMRAGNPGQELPSFGILEPADPANPTAAESEDIANANRILYTLFGHDPDTPDYNFLAQMQMATLGVNQIPAPALSRTPTQPNRLNGAVPPPEGSPPTGVGHEFSITVNGVEHEFNTWFDDGTGVYRHMTFQEVMNRINAIDGVSIVFNTTTGAFTIGATSDLNEANFRAEGLEFMGFASTVELESYDSPRLARQARDAIIYYDVGGSGLDPVQVRQASNTFEIHGMRINITNAVETMAADGTGGVFTINAERNIDGAMEAILNFVEAYNELIRELNALHTTPRPRAGNHHRGALFDPLTDEQRQGMSDREIERWEEQARIGLLHRDRDIRNIQQQLRSLMFAPVVLARDENGRVTDQISLHQIGISTVGLGGAPGDQLIGVLQVDTDRLREALEDNPERVQGLFAANGSQVTEDGTAMPWGTIEQRNARSSFVGLGFRVDDILNNAAADRNGSLQQRAGYHSGLNVSENIMTRQLRDYDRRIEAMQAFLIRRENHFFNMFARMEQAMAQSHAQMDSLFAFMTQ